MTAVAASHDHELATWSQALRRDPQDPEALLGLARQFLRTGRLPDFLGPDRLDALRALEAAHRGAPGLAELRQALSQGREEVGFWIWRDLASGDLRFSLPRLRTTLWVQDPPSTKQLAPGFHRAEIATSPVFERRRQFRVRESHHTHIPERYRKAFDEGKPKIQYLPKEHQLWAYADDEVGPPYYHTTIDYSFTLTIFLEEGLIELHETVDSE